MKKSLIRLTFGTLLTAVIFSLSACGGGADSTTAQAQDTVANVVEKANQKAVDVAEQGAAAEAEAPAQASAAGVDKEILAIYQRSCISCHLSGAANAPKSHDTAAWAPKLAKGMDALVASINNGLNAMPPKGLCFDCSDDQYKALVEFMAGPKPD